ncbi:RnfABCDGE type electron transport complex subunit B [bacterium]|nr:RnfABCDGE type electron transport complex subunit B [bacterium]
MESGLFLAMLVLGGLGLVFGAGLAIASKIFYVQRDKRIEMIEAVLPGANCGACGAPGCSGFAEGVTEGKYSVGGCTAGGPDVAALVAEIMGTEAEASASMVAVVQCRGGRDKAAEAAVYSGIEDCRAAILVDNGPKACEYGCLGFGTCEAACPFDAIVMSGQGLPVVNEALCTGCGECVKACPRNIMALLPKDRQVFLGCVSPDFGKSVKSVCSVGCIGCGICANPKFVEDEKIVMDGKLPVIQYEKIGNGADELKNSIEKCPSGCFVIRGKVPTKPRKETADIES